MILIFNANENPMNGLNKYYNLVYLPHIARREFGSSAIDTSGTESYKLKIKKTEKINVDPEAPILEFIDMIYLRSWGYTVQYTQEEDRKPRGVSEWVF